MRPDQATVADRRHLATSSARALGVILIGVFAWQVLDYVMTWGRSSPLLAIIDGTVTVAFDSASNLVVGVTLIMAARPLSRLIVPLGQRLDTCPACGYSLKNLKSPICPECGADIRPVTTPSPRLSGADASRQRGR